MTSNPGKVVTDPVSVLSTVFQGVDAEHDYLQYCFRLKDDRNLPYRSAYIAKVNPQFIS